MFETAIKWSEREFVHLPWRVERTLYSTLVSELMLQQTTVSTVINYYRPFLDKYPTVEALANATEEEVLMSWKGLGYYRRARNLHGAVKEILKKHAGIIPQDFETLLAIPGIGAYTANALLSIGGDQQAFPVDANLERIISRLYGLRKKKGPKLQKEISHLFSEGKIIANREKYSFRALAETLMDVGRVFCQANKANCSECPLSKNCMAYHMGNPLGYPLSGEKKASQKQQQLELLRILVKKDGKVLAYKKNESEWLSGQLEIPTFILESEDKKLTQYPLLNKSFDLALLKNFKTGITKYRINNFVAELSEAEFKQLGLDMSRYSFYHSDPSVSNYSTSTLKAFNKLD